MEKCSKVSFWDFQNIFFTNAKIFPKIFFEILNFQRWNVFSMEPKAKKTKIRLNKMFIVCRL